MSTRRTWLRRREVLAAVGTAGAATLAGQVAGTSDGTVSSASDPLTVRVYPGPVPAPVRLRHGWRPRENWPPPFEEARQAVTTACDAIVSESDALTASVDRGPSLSREEMNVPPLLPTRSGVLDAFADVLRDRDAFDNGVCHLLFWWGPLHARVGYGGATGHVASDDGGIAVANVGATELWDSRAVTRNIAIHEVLHTYLTSEETEELVGTNCDHDLGMAARSGETLTVTPLATAYAAPQIGAGTRWPGSGCVNRESFARHDGTDGVRTVAYTETLSPATRQGVRRYLERRLL